MMGIVDSICSAIAQMEGWNIDGSRPRRSNNPGDLRAAPWIANAKMDGGYWKADTPAQGIAGLYHQVTLDIARGYSLKLLIYAWAPASDGNDPTSYLNHVMQWTGITDPNVPLWNFLELRKI
jgi:hypothetical protein